MTNPPTSDLKMDSLNELRRRKAELKDRIDQQQNELKQTFQEVREEIEPAKLLKKAVGGMFNFKQDVQSGFFNRLPAPLSFAADLLIKDPKWGFVVKFVAPLALKYLKKEPKENTENNAEEIPEVSMKKKVFGSLRRGVSKLRNSLRKNKNKTGDQPENEAEKSIEPTQN